MARKAKPVRHLLNRDGRYFARVAVPAKLKDVVGKRELLEPLGPDRGVAIVRLHEAVARFHKTLAQARRGLAPSPPAVSIRRAVHDHYAAELVEDERLEEPGRPDTRRFDEDFAAPLLRNLRKIARGQISERDWTDPDASERAELVRKRLARLHADPEDEGDIRPRKDSIATAEVELSTVDTFVEATIGWAIGRACEGKQRPKPGSKEYFELAKALASAQIEVMQRVRERDAGNYDGKPAYALLRDAKAPVPIEGLLETYLGMLAKAGRGVEAGKRWRPCFRSLIAFLGHDNARLVAKADLNRWIEHLRERSLAEKTIKDVYLGSVKAVFGYAVELDLLDSNPAQSIKIRTGRREQAREKWFTPEESQSILRASRSYVPKPSDNPQTREGECMVAAKRWAPILCAFTGARISEMTQLRKEDVRAQDGISYFRLTPDAGSIKTRHYRDVPVHPQLVAAGFLDFVARSPDGPLFFRDREDRRGTTHPSKTVAGRVSQWLRTLDAVPASVAPNHGWRHTFKTVGREAGISDRVLDAIQGHAPKTAGDAYGDVTLKTKALAIEKLPSISI